MRKSKRIKALEVRVETLSILTEILIDAVYEKLDKKNKEELDAGKWYKDRS